MSFDGLSVNGCESNSRANLSSNGDTSVMKSLLAMFIADEGGATAIEYGLIAAGISVAIIAVVQGMGSKLKSTFTSVQNALN